MLENQHESVGGSEKGEVTPLFEKPQAPKPAERYQSEVAQFKDTLDKAEVPESEKQKIWEDIDQFFQTEISALLPEKGPSILADAANRLIDRLKGGDPEKKLQEAEERLRQAEALERQRIEDLVKVTIETQTIFQAGIRIRKEAEQMRKEAENAPDDQKSWLLQQADFQLQEGNAKLNEAVGTLKAGVEEYNDVQLDVSTELAVRLDQAKVLLANLYPLSADYQTDRTTIDKQRAKLLNDAKKNIAQRGVLEGVAKAYPEAFKDYKGFDTWINIDNGEVQFSKKFNEASESQQQGVMLQLQNLIARENDRQGLETATGNNKKYFEGKVALAEGRIDEANKALKEFRKGLLAEGSPDAEKKAEVETLLRTIAGKQLSDLAGDIQKTIAQRSERKLIGAENIYLKNAQKALSSVMKILESGEAVTFEEAWSKSGVDKEQVWLAAGERTTLDKGLGPYAILFQTNLAEGPAEKAALVAAAVDELSSYGGSTETARRILDDNLKEDLDAVQLPKELAEKVRLDAEQDAAKYAQEIKEQVLAEAKNYAKQIESLDAKLAHTPRHLEEYRQLVELRKSLVDQLGQRTEIHWSKGEDDQSYHVVIDGEFNKKFLAERTGAVVEKQYQTLLRREKYLALSGSLKNVDSEKQKLVEAAIKLDDLRGEYLSFASDSIHEAIDTGAQAAFDISTMLVGAGGGALAKLAATKLLAKVVAKGGLEALAAKGLIWGTEQAAGSFSTHLGLTSIQAFNLQIQGQDGAEAFADFSAGWGQSALLFASTSASGALFAKGFGKAVGATKTGGSVALREASFKELSASGRAQWLAYHSGQIATEVAAMAASEEGAALLDQINNGTPAEREVSLHSLGETLGTVLKFRLGAKAWKGTRIGKEIFGAEERLHRKAGELVQRAAFENAAKFEAPKKKLARNERPDFKSVEVQEQIRKNKSLSDEFDGKERREALEKSLQKEYGKELQLTDKEWAAIFEVHNYGKDQPGMPEAVKNRGKYRIALEHEKSLRTPEEKQRWRKIYTHAVDWGFAGLLGRVFKRTAAATAAERPIESKEKAPGPKLVSILEKDARGKPKIDPGWEVESTNPDGSVNLKRTVTTDDYDAQEHVEYRDNVRLNDLVEPVKLEAKKLAVGQQVYVVDPNGVLHSTEALVVSEVDSKGIITVTDKDKRYPQAGLDSRYLITHLPWEPAPKPVENRKVTIAVKPVMPIEQQRNEAAAKGRELFEFSDKRLEGIVASVFDGYAYAPDFYQVEGKRSEAGKFLPEIFEQLRTASEFLPQIAKNSDLSGYSVKQLEKFHEVTVSIGKLIESRYDFLKAKNGGTVPPEATKWLNTVAEKVNAVNTALTGEIIAKGGTPAEAYLSEKHLYDASHVQNGVVVESHPEEVHVSEPEYTEPLYSSGDVVTIKTADGELSGFKVEHINSDGTVRLSHPDFQPFDTHLDYIVAREAHKAQGPQPGEKVAINTENGIIKGWDVQSINPDGSLNLTHPDYPGHVIQAGLDSVVTASKKERQVRNNRPDLKSEVIQKEIAENKAISDEFDGLQRRALLEDSLRTKGDFPEGITLSEGEWAVIWQMHNYRNGENISEAAKNHGKIKLALAYERSLTDPKAKERWRKIYSHAIDWGFAGKVQTTAVRPENFVERVKRVFRIVPDVAKVSIPLDQPLTDNEKALIGSLYPNGIKESHFSQQNTGNCYLLAALNSVKNHPVFPYLIARSIRKTNKGWEVNFPGMDNPFLVTADDLKGQDVNQTVFKQTLEGQLGDRIIDVALSKWKKSILLNGGNKNPVLQKTRIAAEGGYAIEGLQAMLGTNLEYEYQAGLYGPQTMSQHPYEVSDAVALLNRFADNPGQHLLTAATPSGLVTPYKRYLDGEFGRDQYYMDPEFRFPQEHAYSIVAVNKEHKVVIVVNVHDTKNMRYALSYSDFLKYFAIIQGAKIKSFNLDHARYDHNPKHNPNHSPHPDHLDFRSSFLPKNQVFEYHVDRRGLEVHLGKTFRVNIHRWNDKMIVEFSSKGKRIILSNGESIVVGRAHQSFLQNEMGISNDHLQITNSNGRLFLKDLGSTNGTFTPIN